MELFVTIADKPIKVGFSYHTLYTVSTLNNTILIIYIYIIIMHKNNERSIQYDYTIRDYD